MNEAIARPLPPGEALQRRDVPTGVDRKPIGERFGDAKRAVGEKTNAAVSAFKRLSERSPGTIDPQDIEGFEKLIQEHGFLDAAADTVIVGDQGQLQAEATSQVKDSVQHEGKLQKAGKMARNIAPGVAAVGISLGAERLNIPYYLASNMLKYGPGVVAGALGGLSLEPVNWMLRKVGKDTEAMSKGKQRVVKGANLAVGVLGSVVPTAVLGPSGAVVDDALTMGISTASSVLKRG